MQDQPKKKKEGQTKTGQLTTTEEAKRGKTKVIFLKKRTSSQPKNQSKQNCFFKAKKLITKEETAAKPRGKRRPLSHETNHCL